MMKLPEFTYILSMFISVAGFAVHLTVRRKDLSATSSLAKQNSTTLFLLFILIFNISDYVIIYFGKTMPEGYLGGLYAFQNILEVLIIYALIYMEKEYAGARLPRAVDFTMAVVVMALIYFDLIFDWNGVGNETAYFWLMMLINAVPIVILSVCSIIYIGICRQEKKDRNILGYFAVFIIATIILCIVSTATNADFQTSRHFLVHSREEFEFIWCIFNIMTFGFVWRTISVSPKVYYSAGISDEELFGMIKDEFGLSERETEIGRLLYMGKNNKSIADELFLSPNTVKVHASNLYRKLGVTNRVEAIQLISDRKTAAHQGSGQDT